LIYIFFDRTDGEIVPYGRQIFNVQIDIIKTTTTIFFLLTMWQKITNKNLWQIKSVKKKKQYINIYKLTPLFFSTHLNLTLYAHSLKTFTSKLFCINFLLFYFVFIKTLMYILCFILYIFSVDKLYTQLHNPSQPTLCYNDGVLYGVVCGYF
jgi:hypothetical protein